jgi:hypothetical protein
VSARESSSAFVPGQLVEVQARRGADWEPAVYLHDFAMWDGWHAVELERVCREDVAETLQRRCLVPKRRLRPRKVR